MTVSLMTKTLNIGMLLAATILPIDVVAQNSSATTPQAPQQLHQELERQRERIAQLEIVVKQQGLLLEKAGF